jgi:hypothetical protein
VKQLDGNPSEPAKGAYGTLAAARKGAAHSVLQRQNAKAKMCCAPTGRDDASSIVYDDASCLLALNQIAKWDIGDSA